MREPRPSHDPFGHAPHSAEPGEAELFSVFEDLWRQRYTGKLLLHFRAGYPSFADILPHSRGRRWRIRRPSP